MKWKRKKNISILQEREEKAIQTDTHISMQLYGKSKNN